MSASPSNTRVVRRVQDNRLVWYRSDYDDDFWLRAWSPVINADWYRQFELGALYEHEAAFNSFLPKKGKIIEAGCGAGHLVLALKSRGYDIEGIDLSPECVAKVKGVLPDLPISVGDATALDVPDGQYAGLLSLGVAEHIESGPEPFLKEAFRVLAPGGIGIFTVPWFHPLRQLKARLGAYRSPRPDLPFYQFAFGTDEFTGLLRGAGFNIKHISGMAAFKGLKDEFKPLGWLAGRPGWTMPMERWGWRILRALPAIERRVWHMLLVVVEKP